MILFLEDWKKYPNATLQLNTKNTSFIRIAKLLKHMGIKNHAFMLALHNPALMDVDPWNPNITPVEVDMVTEECKQNFWYFIREVYRVPPAAGTIPIMFKANRANISYFWLFFNHITTYLIQPRQTGKSLSYTTVDIYLTNFLVNYTTSVLLKDDPLRVKTAEKHKVGFEYLPPYLNMLDKRDVKNTERIHLKALNNTINFYVGQKDIKSADNTGRGMTTPTAQIDEFAYTRNIDITMPAMLAGTTAAREQAENAGLPYGISLLTTPGKLATKEGRYAFKIYQESFRWTEKLLDSENREELLNYILKNSTFKKAPIVLLEYNHRQLGYTDEWLLERIEISRAEGEDAAADFLNKWATGNLSHPLNKKVLEVIEKSKKDPVDNYISDEGYILRLYMTEREFFNNNLYTHYIISVDPSEAAGRDDIGMVIMDVYTGEVVAAGNFNETSIPMFARFLFSLLKKLPNSTLMVERKSTGTSILDNLAEFLINDGINPFIRIFNWVIDDFDSFKYNYPQIADTRFRDFDLYIKFKNKFGFATSGSGKTSRSYLYGSIIKGAGSYIGEYVNDKLLADQILSLTVRKGRVDHPEGGHDDMVIAWLISYWFMVEAKHKELYGIDGSKVLSTAVDAELIEDATDEEKEYILFQERLKEKITELLDELENAKDNITAARLIGKINLLKQSLDPRYSKSFNVDSILKEMKFYKKLKKLGLLRD